jgi:hypothetical protein
MLRANDASEANKPAATFLTGLQVPDDAESSLAAQDCAVHSSDANATTAATASEDDSGFVGRTLLALDLQRTSYLSEKFQARSMLVCFIMCI